MMPDSNLRIAILSVHSCPVGNLGSKDTGGMSVYIRELACELGKLGHTVDIYTRVHDPRDKQVYHLGQNVRLIHLRAGEDTSLHKLVVYSHLPNFVCNLENFRKQNDLQYDLVFSHYWLSGWVGEYLKQWWNTPHIAMFHTLGAVKNAIGIGEEDPELRIETERDLVSNCHRIIATTKREKEDLVKHYGAVTERISVIPCGVNMELFRPVPQKVAKRQLGFADDKIVLYVGRVEPLKGIDRLLEAVSILQSRPSPKLVIIGGDEQSQYEVTKLKKLSVELNIQDSVIFTGMVKQEELPGFYSAADVCVIPSYYESFGMVALESLACGTPVVATDVGNFRNIIHAGTTGYVVADNTPERLAGKIAILLARPHPDAESAGSIRASVSSFSWPVIAEAVVRDCRMVLDKYAASVG